MAEDARTVWVVRHALSVGNVAGVIQGWQDLPLHPNGEREAEAAAEALKSRTIGHVVSSPLIRARRTAEILFGRVDEIDSSWVEPAAPAVQGMYVAEAVRERPDLMDAEGWPLEHAKTLGDLESPSAVRYRADAAIVRFASSEVPGDVAVVTHGSVMAALLHLSGDKGARPSNLHALRCEVSPDGTWRIIHQGPIGRL